MRVEVERVTMGTTGSATDDEVVPAFRVNVWGSRGSIVAPGLETLRYGGNTSCVQVRLSDDRLLVLDAGTGVKDLGVALRDAHPNRIDVLLSHLHLDHVGGLGFFAPVFDPSCEIHIWGPGSSHRSLREEIDRIMSPPLFPVRLLDLPARFVVHDGRTDEWELGSACITAQFVDHLGPTWGYRIEHEGRVLTYLPDHEPTRHHERWREAPTSVSGFALARGADVLIHDAQYTDEEYGRRAQSGHSSVSQALDFAQLTQARRLIGFHHDPSRSDAQLDAMVTSARTRWGSRGDDVTLAHDGMEIEIPKSGDYAEAA
jgi:ribonuclease BN (tRNA processing enzyme)